MLTLGSPGQLDALLALARRQTCRSRCASWSAAGLAEMSKEGRATTLEMAAVLGTSFDAETLLAVAAPIDANASLRHLDEAIGDHILRQTPNGYAFQHGLPARRRATGTCPSAAHAAAPPRGRGARTVGARAHRRALLNQLAVAPPRPGGDNRAP